MMFTNSGKHALVNVRSRMAAWGLIVSLMSGTVVALSSSSQAAVSVETLTCTTASYEFTGNSQGLSPGLNSTAIALPYNATTQEIEAVAGNRASITLHDGTTLETLEIYAWDLEDDGTQDEMIFQFANYTDVSKTAEQVWPLTVTYGDAPVYESVINAEVSFIGFNPCTGTINDAYTAGSDSPFDYGVGTIEVYQGEDGVGAFAGRWDPLTAYGSPKANRTVTKSIDDVAGSTTYTYLVEDYYSHDESADVDISVAVKFDGNTVSWQVEVFSAGTSETAELTFRMRGTYAGFSDSVFDISNDYNYSSTTTLSGDPILVYATDGDFTHDDQNFLFNFPDGSTDGLVEISIIGYELCATPEAVDAAVDAFTSDYSLQKNTDIAEIQGLCQRSCTPSVGALQVSDNTFDLSGVELCFDRGRTSEDPTSMLNQLRSRVNIGANLPSAGYVDFEDVVIGSDVTLNAILTVVEVSNLEDSVVNLADDFSSNLALNARIRTDINYDDSSTNDQFVKYTLEFYVATDLSKTPVTVSNLNLNIYDIDNFQFAEISNVSQYLIGEDSILTLSNLGGVLRASAADVNSSSGDESRLTTLLATSNVYEIVLGISKDNVGSGDASYSLDFSVGEDWENPPTETPVTEASSGGRLYPPSTPTKPQVKVTAVEGGLNVSLVYNGASSKRPTAYQVSVSPSGNSCVVYGDTSSCEITGLNTGVPYTISIAAINSAGTSGTYVSADTYLLSKDSGSSAFKAKKTIDKFPGDSPQLLNSLKSRVKKFIAKHPEITNFTCTGYTAGPVKKSDKVLAKTRASNVCAYIEKIKPSVSTTTIGKTPGLPFGSANRKVVIRGYSAIG